MAKGYIEPEVQAAIDKMVNLLHERYGAYSQPNGNKYFVITKDGQDGGDIHSNGKYEYNYKSFVSFLTHTREEIIEILDEYFEV